VITTHRAKIADRVHVQTEVRSICAVKLDHIGDFAMATPAFQAMRDAFPSAAIDLVCGRWNLAIARATGLFRAVYEFNFFPENPSNPEERSDNRFPPQISSVIYDLAIDLRVDQDTRVVLGNIKARWYAGIGQAAFGNSNSIVLPSSGLATNDHRFFPVEHTTCCQPGSVVAGNAAVRFTQYHKHKNLVILGPIALMAGVYRAHFLSTFVSRLITRQPIVLLGAFVNGTPVVERRLAISRRQEPCTIDFSVEQDQTPIDLRMRIRRGRFAKIDFHGVLLHKIATPYKSDIDKWAHPSTAQRTRSRLHVAEQLSLLVDLVASRLNGVSFPDCWHTAEAGNGELSIAIAPFSNSSIRDWPTTYYEKLITEIHKHYRAEIVLLGSAGQAEALEKLKLSLKAFGVQQVVVEVGLPMLETIARLSRASLVISNNSGIGHIAGVLGRPVVAIYSASHDVDEWGTIGSNIWIMQADVSCKRCHLESIENCDNSHRCMRDLLPEDVLSLIRGSVVWKGNDQRDDSLPVADVSMRIADAPDAYG
jgi:ADP-heptose:LPS heptosyltransferase